MNGLGALQLVLNDKSDKKSTSNFSYHSSNIGCLMKRILVILCLYVLWILLLSGCKANSEANIPLETAKAGVNDVNIANPAAVNCEKQGFRLEIRTDSDGNQYGVCIFPDGSACDE